MKKKLLQKGFTLIELMIAIAIVAILASVALPAYLDYTTRAKLSEGVVILDGLKLRIEEIYYADGVITDATAPTMPSDGSALGKYIQSVAMEIGGDSDNTKPTRVGVTYNSNLAPANDRCLGLTATLDGGSTPSSLGNAGNLTYSSTGSAEAKITWICRTSSTDANKIPNNYLPPNCRGTTNLPTGIGCVSP